MKYHFGRPDGSDFRLLLQQMSDSEFKNLTRSTIPLLHYWRDAERGLRFLGDAMGTSLERADLTFEYGVKSLGCGKASFTDLMITIPKRLAVGIEAKSTERRYPTVEAWLADHRPNGQRVLNHWLAMIGRVTESIDTDAVKLLPYQLVHRTASVCSVAADRHAVTYETFRIGQPVKGYQADLAAMAAITGPAVEFWLHSVVASTTEEYAKLEKALKTREHDSHPIAIRCALATQDLFQLESEDVRRVGGDESLTAL